MKLDPEAADRLVEQSQPFTGLGCTLAWLMMLAFWLLLAGLAFLIGYCAA